MSSLSLILRFVYPVRLAGQPENLLLDSRGQVKLSDFGWAVQAMPPHHSQRLTMCGTPEYAAPEMLVLRPEYTYLVDIWSLGVLGYELLAGAVGLYVVIVGLFWRRRRGQGGGCCQSLCC